MELSVSIGSASLPNPVGVASGSFGYGKEFADLLPLSRLGALYTKAITPHPRSGNPTPRLVETPCGLINSIGLANVGLKCFLEEKMPFLSRFTCPIIVNVAGSTDDDYEEVVGMTCDQTRIWGYEINISCPNVKRGGLSCGINPTLVKSLTQRLRSLTPKPLIMKLSPNVTDITVMARAAEEGGADAISCINTVVGMVIDVEKRRPAIPSGLGGLSGPAIRPIGVAAVYRVSRAVSLPVIGIGGISSPRDALEYLLAGASAIQVGTALFSNPRIPLVILEGIERYMEKEGFSSLTDLHACLAD